LYRDINEFEKGYQPRINIIVLNVHEVHNVRLVDIHTAEPLVPEPGFVEVEIAIGKLKKL
jgi:hypothetical protein